jgi:hemolysin activation/secretion protein
MPNLEFAVASLHGVLSKDCVAIGSVKKKPDAIARRQRSLKSWSLLLAFALSNAAFGQQPPDAGRILQEHKIPPGPLPQKPEPTIIEEPIRPVLKAPAGVKFKVADFRFSGSSAFPDTELKPLLKDLIGTEVTLADLERAADRITRYYRDHGYFVARAYVPAQEIKDGIVEILILEGKLGQIDVQIQGKVRIQPGYLDNVVLTAVPRGQVLRQEALERAMLLINDLPGIDAQATLVPGTEQAATNVRLDVREGPLLTGTLEYDNYGNKFTGRNRPGVSVNLNDPTGIGDQARFRYNGLSDNQYYNLAYTAPIGYRGLKLGGAYTYTNYHLCCDFAPLDATGRAEVASVNVRYPFVRTRDINLIGLLAFDYRSFYNATINGTTSDKRSQVLTATLAYDQRDGLLGGGLDFASINLVRGNLNLNHFQPDLLFDENTARTNGHFTKASLTLSRLQSLRQDWTLYLGLNSQFASKNLDSSEKVALGGPSGVRSYPQNEAAGDEGTIVNVELRRDINERLQLFAFADYGHIKLHHQVWAGWQGSNTTLSNSYYLASGGLGLNYDKPGDYALHAVVAQRIGSNPGRDANGNDSDGKHDNTRLWVQALKRF